MPRAQTRTATGSIIKEDEALCPSGYDLSVRLPQPVFSCGTKYARWEAVPVLALCLCFISCSSLSLASSTSLSFSSFLSLFFSFLSCYPRKVSASQPQTEIGFTQVCLAVPGTGYASNCFPPSKGSYLHYLHRKKYFPHPYYKEILFLARSHFPTAPINGEKTAM